MALEDSQSSITPPSFEARGSLGVEGHKESSAWLPLVGVALRAQPLALPHVPVSKGQRLIQ